MCAIGQPCALFFADAHAAGCDPVQRAAPRLPSSPGVRTCVSPPLGRHQGARRPLSRPLKAPSKCRLPREALAETRRRDQYVPTHALACRVRGGWEICGRSVTSARGHWAMCWCCRHYFWNPLSQNPESVVCSSLRPLPALRTRALCASSTRLNHPTWRRQGGGGRPRKFVSIATQELKPDTSAAPRPSASPPPSAQHRSSPCRATRSAAREGHIFAVCGVRLPVVVDESC